MHNVKLFALLSAVGVTLAVPTGLSGATTALEAGAPAARQQAALKAAAGKAEAKVMASAAAQTAFANAKNDAEVRALLLSNGFTTSDLAGAKIKLNREGNNAGGPTARRAKISITYTCCPSTITVTVRW